MLVRSPPSDFLKHEAEEKREGTSLMRAEHNVPLERREGSALVI